MTTPEQPAAMEITMETPRGVVRVSLQGSASAQLAPADKWRHTPQSDPTSWTASAYRESGQWVVQTTVHRRTGSRHKQTAANVRRAVHTDVMTTLNSLPRETLVIAEINRLRAEIDSLPKKMQGAQAHYLALQAQLSILQREARKLEASGDAGDKVLRGD